MKRGASKESIDGRENKLRPNKHYALHKPTARSRVTNGRDLLPDVDHRSQWVRRFRDVLSLHVSDLGGESNCSEAEKLARRAACLVVELEQLECKFARAGEATPLQFENYQRGSNPGLRPAKSTRDEQLLLAGDFLQRAPNPSMS